MTRVIGGRSVEVLRSAVRPNISIMEKHVVIRIPKGFEEELTEKYIKNAYYIIGQLAGETKTMIGDMTLSRVELHSADRSRQVSFTFMSKSEVYGRS